MIKGSQIVLSNFKDETQLRNEKLKEYNDSVKKTNQIQILLINHERENP